MVWRLIPLIVLPESLLYENPEHLSQNLSQGLLVLIATLQHPKPPKPPKHPKHPKHPGYRQQRPPRSLDRNELSTISPPSASTSEKETGATSRTTRNWRIDQHFKSIGGGSNSLSPSPSTPSSHSTPPPFRSVLLTAFHFDLAAGSDF